MNIIDIKQKYSIIGHHPLLNRAVEIATQVAPTDLNVVLMGKVEQEKKFFLKLFMPLVHVNTDRTLL